MEPKDPPFIIGERTVSWQRICIKGISNKLTVLHTMLLERHNVQQAVTTHK
jgi:hypothetical protein